MWRVRDDHTAGDIRSPEKATVDVPPCKTCESRLALIGTDAQIQTSYEDTLFPIGFAALKQFNAFFQDQDIQTDFMQADSTTSASSCMHTLAQLVENFDVSIFGDRGKSITCSVCHRVYPEDHRVTCRWCNKTPLCLYRCGGFHARYYYPNRPRL